MVKGAENPSEVEDVERPSLGDGLKSQLSVALDRTRERTRLLQGSWQHISGAPAHLVREWNAVIAPGGTVRSMTYVLIFLFIGGGLEWLYRQYTNNRLLRLQLIHPTSLSGRVKAAMWRALLSLADWLSSPLAASAGFSVLTGIHSSKNWCLSCCCSFWRCARVPLCPCSFWHRGFENCGLPPLTVR